MGLAAIALSLLCAPPAAGHREHIEVGQQQSRELRVRLDDPRGQHGVRDRQMADRDCFASFGPT